MRWSIETKQSPTAEPQLMLRDDKGGPIALVSAAHEGWGSGYMGMIFAVGFPSEDDFKTPHDAVLWVEGYVRRHIDKGAKFGAVPELPARKARHGHKGAA